MKVKTLKSFYPLQAACIAVYLLVKATNNCSAQEMAEQIIAEPDIASSQVIVETKEFSSAYETEIKKAVVLRETPVKTKKIERFNLIEVPENSKYHGQKTFEYASAITNKKSKQYALLQDSESNDLGFKTLNDRYLIAIGTYFDASVGTYVDLVLENGEEIECIIGDIKADKDTDSLNVFSACGCCSEFIVDSDFVSLTDCPGDVSSVMENWDSKVVSIKVYDKSYFE